MISDVKNVTGRIEYDLVKVDVEGYELEVLKNLKNISMKYLFTEVSVSRKKTFTHAQFYKVLRDDFGESDILLSIWN